MRTRIIYLILIVLPLLCSLTINAQGNKVPIDSIKNENIYSGGFGIFPLPNRTMISYRSNITKKWAFDSKYGYTFSAFPQFNIELNIMRRHFRNEIINFYNGFGLTIDGFTPGVNIPIGFEFKPIEKYQNIVFVVEASPKITFSFSSAFYSTLNGNIGIIYFRPSKKKNK